MLAVSIILLLVVLIAAASYACYRLAFSVPKQSNASLFKMPHTEQYTPYAEATRQMTRSALAIPYEAVTITSYDGLELFGKYYPASESAPWLIMLHGYRSGAERDFCGGLPFGIAAGFNVLLVDQRAHGKSQGRTITFGVKERWDVLSWVDFALERFGPDTKILLYGISMGASTVLMASELPLPENVKGIIADCPYSSPAKIIASVGRKMRIPAGLAASFSWVGAKVYGSFDLLEADSVRAVKKAKVPILLIHGESDGFVPCDMSAEIQRANPSQIYRCTFPGADHGISFLVNPERYRKLVGEFCEKILT